MTAAASNPDSVKVPRELHSIRASALEEYVRARIDQFASALAPRLQEAAASLTSESIDRAVADTLQALPAPDYGQVPLENMELQLVFRHDCLALGCLDPQCVLCQHNSNRRCSVNFDRKYLVNDVLKAKCGAIIRVELVDKATGMVVEETIPDLCIEMVMLDGNMYDTKFLESNRTLDNSPDADRELENCMLLLNNKQQPLLMSGPGGVNDPSGKVVLQLQRGKAVIPEIHVTDSSEALLSGRKPPYRLLVQAVCKGDGPRLNIRYAVSEGFVVATRRTRTAGKADIPSMDDHVSKLEHMGKETVKKLQDIQGAAIQSGIEINIPENCVQKVGDFKQLALRAEQDGHLRQKLQHVLKLSKEKWDEARDHSMKAVVADNRMRAWYADRGAMDVGLLFLTRLGNVDLERPIGLLQHKTENGEAKIECTLMAQQTPTQRELVRTLNPQAAHNWWLPGHPGWAIFPMDSEVFMQTGQLLGPPSVQPSSPSPETSTPSYPPSPSLQSSLQPQPRSISPPHSAPHVPPPRLTARSMPPNTLGELLGDYNENIIAKLTEGLPQPRAPQSDPTRHVHLPGNVGIPGNHLGDYPSHTISTSPFNQGTAGLFSTGPHSPALSPSSENAKLVHPVPSPRLHIGNNHHDYSTMADVLERGQLLKRKKETVSHDTEPLNYQSRAYSTPSEPRSPSRLTPPGSPINAASLPTPFRPLEHQGNPNFRSPILTPLPPAGLHHYSHGGFSNAAPQGTFAHPPPEYSDPPFPLTNEVSLTGGLLRNFPDVSIDLGVGGMETNSMELPPEWKQVCQLSEGSLTLTALPHSWQVARANSGLETMQSIEEALPNFDSR